MASEPMQAFALARPSCGKCPRLPGIAFGLSQLHNLGSLTPEDVTDLTTPACSGCAIHSARVDLLPGAKAPYGRDITNIWVRLFPATDGSVITHRLIKRI